MIQIDYYQGAYGPTIWVEADSSSDLDDLLAVFHALARGTLEEVELCAAIKAHTRNLSALQLRADDQVRDRRKRLTRSSSYNRLQSRLQSPRPEPPSFVWSERRSGWQQLATRVEGLIRRNCAANHDLTEEGVDGVFVELSFQGAA